MPSFALLSSACILAVLFAVSEAAAPAGQPVEFQITQSANSSPFCLSAASNTNGQAVTIIQCDTTFPSGFQWTVDKGGASSGIGPLSEVKIFGGKCLDVVGGVNADGTKLQIWDCDTNNANPNQLFHVNSDGTIQWGSTNKCLDLVNGVFTARNPVQLWDCTVGNTNQRWQAVPQALLAGKKIQTSANGATNCISAGSDSNGAAVTIQPCVTPSATGNSTWSVPASGEGAIQTFNNKCLDVTNGANADGTKLQIWDCVPGSTNQLFLSVRGGDTDVIQWSGTNKCVDLTNGVTTAGNPIQLWTCVSGSANQQWSELPDF